MPRGPDRNRPLLTTNEGREARLREVVADVAFRLAGVCSGIPPEEFAGLARRIADITVKYEALAELRGARQTAAGVVA